MLPGLLTALWLYQCPDSKITAALHSSFPAPSGSTLGTIMPFSKAMCYIAVFSVMPGGSCMGRCGVSACSNHRCRTGMHLAHKWCRQQDPHFCGVSFEIPKVKLSCKTARIHYLSTQESHRGACTLCLELGHTVRLKIGTELVLLRDLTFSVHC